MLYIYSIAYINIICIVCIYIYIYNFLTNVFLNKCFRILHVALGNINNFKFFNILCLNNYLSLVE